MCLFRVSKKKIQVKPHSLLLLSTTNLGYYIVYENKDSAHKREPMQRPGPVRDPNRSSTINTESLTTQYRPITFPPPPVSGVGSLVNPSLLQYNFIPSISGRRGSSKLSGTPLLSISFSSSVIRFRAWLLGFRSNVRWRFQSLLYRMFVLRVCWAATYERSWIVLLVSCSFSETRRCKSESRQQGNESAWVELIELVLDLCFGNLELFFLYTSAV